MAPRSADSILLKIQTLDKGVRKAMQDLIKLQDRLDKAIEAGSKKRTATARALIKEKQRELRQSRLDVRNEKAALKEILDIRRKAASEERRQAAEARKRHQAAAKAARDALRLEKQGQRESARLAKERSRLEREAARDSTRRAREASRAITSANRAAAQSARAAVARQRAHTAQLRATGDAARALTHRVIALVAAYAGYRIVQRFIASGFQFNAVIENSTIGVAALISAETELTDVHGRLIEGTEALSSAMILADEQIRRLRIAGIQTAATTVQLVDAFQQAVGAGIKVGLTLDQIREFTVRVTQAAFVLGLPMNQINQEVRSILDATIDRNSRVAKALQLTNAEVKLAREHGELATLLVERFKAFDVAGQRSLRTFTVLKSNFVEAVEVFAGDIVRPTFEQIRDVGLITLGSLFDFETAQVAENLRPLVEGFQKVFEAIGIALADAMTSALESAQSLNEWFEANEDAVNTTVQSFALLFREIGKLVAAFFGFPGDVAKAGTEAGSLAESLRIAAAFVKVVRENLDLIVVALTGLIIKGGIAAIIAGGPVSIVIASIVALATAVTFLTDRYKNLAIERVRTQQSTFRKEIRGSADLISQYRVLSERLKDVAEDSDEYNDIQADLIRTTQALKAGTDAYNGVLDDQALSVQEVSRALNDLTRKREIDFAVQASIALDQLESAKSQQQALKDQADALAKQKPAFGEFTVGRVSEAETLREEARLMGQQVEVLQVQADEMMRTLNQINLNRAELDAAFARIKPLRPEDAGASAGTVNDEQERQRGILAVVKAAAEARKAILQDDIANNRRSMESFIREMALIEETILNQEIAVRQAIIDHSKDKGAIDRARQEIVGFEEERRALHLQVNRDIQASDRDLAEKLRSNTLELLSLTGGDLQAKTRQIAEDYYGQLIEAIGNQDWERVDIINRIIDLKQAQTQADEFGQLIGRLNTDLQTRLERIDFQVQAGVLGEVDAQEQIAAAYTDTANQVDVLIAKLESLSGVLAVDPDFIQGLEKARNGLIELRVRAEEAGNKWIQANRDIRDSIVNNLTNSFADLVTTFGGTASSFSEMTQSILQDITRILIQMQIMKVLQGFSLFGGGSNISFPGAPGASDISAGAIPHATGGYISGPGTGTSDSILSRLSNGEFVMRAAVVHRLGRGFFEALNASARRPTFKRGIPSFASGGAVAVSGGGGDSRLGVGLGPGLRLTDVKTPAGKKVMVEFMSDNRRILRRILK